MEKRILLVDDDEMTAEVQQFTLETLDVSVSLAADGDEALAYLQSNDPVDLVITDLVMPRMDGLELIRRMKESDRLRDTGIILCTGESDQAAATKAAELGCTHCLVKPVHPEVLLTAVRNILG